MMPVCCRAGTTGYFFRTRLLALVILPFLLGAFTILYVFPMDTARLFAWPIKPTMTSLVLASADCGGAYFFVRVLFERRWNVIKIGFASVTLFASLLGVATVSCIGGLQSPARDLLAVGGALLHHALPGVWGMVGEPSTPHALLPQMSFASAGQPGG